MCCNDIIEKIMDCICAKITRLYVSLPIVTYRYHKITTISITIIRYI